MFANVAKRYDLMNDAMSFGVHRLWKRQAIKILNPKPHEQLLDLAGGTGDLSLRMLEHCPDLKAPIMLCDISPNMLVEGQKRWQGKGLEHRIQGIVGSAEAIPLNNNTVDAGIISFGLRNVTHIDKALSEVYRTLNYGGRFYCLEFSHVALPWLAKLYDQFSYKLIPMLGQILAKDKQSYQYLVESIRAFPEQELLKQAFEGAGFQQCRYQNFSGGIVALHVGWKL